METDKSVLASATKSTIAAPQTISPMSIPDTKSTVVTPDPAPSELSALKSATPLTPLQLNAIRLDVKHTILSPDYLENLAPNNPQ